VWMKVSEIARYWAARELTAINREADRTLLDAPFACPDLTLRLTTRRSGPPEVSHAGSSTPLREVRAVRDLTSGTWHRSGDRLTVCFDLGKGRTTVS